MIGSTPRFLSYQPGNSLLHRLDPRTKLLGTAALVAAALVAAMPYGMAVAWLAGAVVGAAAHTLLPALWRVLRPLLVLIVLFGVIIVIVTPGKAYFHLWIMAPSHDGLDLAVRLSLQAVLIVFTTSLLTLTTAPLGVADALEWTFGFLERFRVPVRDIIAMVAIGLTFVPLLIEETQKVIAAQRARGAELGMSALFEEESMGALLIPLLLANLRRGEELAESMESRLYATGPRTTLHQRKFGSLDALAALFVAVAAVAVGVVTFM